MAGTHWAAHLVGEPWTPARNCWWLVRQFFLIKHGIDMPHVEVGDFSETGLDNVASIKRSASASGWRRCDGPPQEDDVLVMTSPFHRRHVGVMTRADGRLGVLHSDGSLTPRGPRGCVQLQTLADATGDGYGHFEIWRRE